MDYHIIKNIPKEKIYFKTDLGILINDDCLNAMRNMPENSIDTIITDPPYGLSFMGKKWDYDVPSIDIWQECLRVLKPGGTALVFAGSRTQHRMAINIEDAGFILKDIIIYLYGSGFPKATDISKQLDKKVERKVIGKQTNLAGGTNNTMVKGSWGNGSPESINITIPSTPEAQQWDGWKSHGLKPAYEPIIVAMKPNEGSYAQNALKWGVSGLNIDGGRIGTDNTQSKCSMTAMGQNTGWNKHNNREVMGGSNCGRFPSNVIFDEEVAEMLDEQTEGKPSRFFYCAKASKAERNSGCNGLPLKPGGSTVKGYVRDLENRIDRNKPVANHHPTVKPLKLMEYLCTLTKTPTGGIVLDPFMGSGTTGCACVNTNRQFIGIERERDYCEIAKQRIEQYRQQLKLAI